MSMSSEAPPAAPSTTVKHQRVPVEELAHANTEILTFGCEIPSDMSFVPRDPDDPLAAASPIPVNRSSDENQGIVGTITMLGSKSVMVWFGWGRIRHDVLPSAQQAGQALNVGVGG
jgi:hypothetical protein